MGGYVSRMTECVNQLPPVSFIKCVEAPSGEISDLVRRGNDNLEVSHYRFFVHSKVAATPSLMGAP